MKPFALPKAVRSSLARTVLAAACVAALAAPVAAQAQGYSQTRYPVVLVHGMLGFDAIGPVSYFYRVPGALRAGGATVFTPSVSALGSTEVRGEQLLAELRRLRATYGYTKFNLIGHSHGGPTARYVAGVAPELVASVTSVGSPHTGTPVADLVGQVTSNTGTTSLAASMFNLLAGAISWMSGAQLPQNALGSLSSLSTAGSARFNARFSAGMPTSLCGQGAELVNGVRYYSAGGTAVVTHWLDVSDAVLAFTSRYMGGPNDGLVGRCSTHWGTVLRDDFGWNHMDEVNQAFGLRGWFSADPLAFYRSHANRLQAKGL